MAAPNEPRSGPNPVPGSGIGQFVAEMKRRHVVRFALGYAAAAFVVLQLAEIVFPAFGIGETGLRILVVAVALLFPPAVVLAWVFDITLEGIKRTEELPGSQADRRPGRLTPRLALLVFTLTVVGAVGVWMSNVGVLERAIPTRGGDRAQRTPELVAYDSEMAIRSLAVLPLETFSETGGQDYFSAGMHEELIAQLSQIAGLRVVSRTSVMRYAGTDTPIQRIGQDLQVDAVIEGSIRRDENQVRITVQLIHAASDTHVWTQQYDRSLENILSLQSEVALDIARQVQAELSPEEADMLQQTAARDVDPEAQDAYLRGKYEYDKGTPEGYRTAMEFFARAVDEDSSFAPALTGLAGTRFLVGMAAPELQTEQIERAHREAERALDVDSASVEARDLLSIIERTMPRVSAARGSGARGDAPAPRGVTAPAAPGVPAVAGMDSTWTAAMSQMGRRIEEQARLRGVDSDRESHFARVASARQLIASGMSTEAADMLSGVVDEAPDLVPAWDLLARVHVTTGQVDEAVRTVERWSSTGADGAPDAASVRTLRDGVTRLGATGYWQWMLGRLDARRAAGEPIQLTDYAAAQLGTGNREGALASLEQALARRERALVSLRSDPVWDALRADARFTEIARKVRRTGR